MKHEIPHLLQTDGPAIVNTSSVAGRVGFPMLSNYSASKHGIIGLTRSAALEFAEEGLRVNAVCPGIIDTPMARENPDIIDEALESTPMARVAEPSEVAGPAVWLCSDEASFITGVALPVDGRQLAG